VAEKSGGKDVLVVDDADEMRTVIRRALSSRGYRVDVAASLAQARGMNPARYDAVLVDAHLGAERGLDLIEAMLAEDPAAAGRCLVITGGAAAQLPDGVACLAKPFQLKALVNAVRVLLQPAALLKPTPVPAPQRHSGTLAAAARRAASAPPGAGQQPAGTCQLGHLLALTRRLRERERHELVDFLHDGPIQELAALTLELQMMSRSAELAPALSSVLQRLNATAGSLRWLVDGTWPFAAPETRLADALQRTTWMLAAPAIVDSGEQEPEPSAAEIPLIVDIVELMLLEFMTPGSSTRARVIVRPGNDLIQIELTLVPAAGDEQMTGDPAAAHASLDKLAFALGGIAHAAFRPELWCAQIDLPRRSSAASKTV
jgi:DNA-binding response OmpR family regulator